MACMKEVAKPHTIPAPIMKHQATTSHTIERKPRIGIPWHSTSRWEVWHPTSWWGGLCNIQNGQFSSRRIAWLRTEANACIRGFRHLQTCDRIKDKENRPAGISVLLRKLCSQLFINRIVTYLMHLVQSFTVYWECHTMGNCIVWLLYRNHELLIFEQWHTAKQSIKFVLA